MIAKCLIKNNAEKNEFMKNAICRNLRNTNSINETGFLT